MPTTFGFLAAGTTDPAGKIQTLKLIADPDNDTIGNSTKPINVIFDEVKETGTEKNGKKILVFAANETEVDAKARLANTVLIDEDPTTPNVSNSKIILQGGSRARGGSSKRTQKRRQRKQQRRNGNSKRV